MSDHDVISITPPDDGFETLLRQRLGELADHAPTTVRQIDETTVRIGERSHRGRRLLGVAASVAVLAGAGTLAFVVSGRNDVAGAATPDEAVTALVTALENEDVLGAIDLLDPAEVPALRSALDQLRGRAAQVGVISDELSLGAVRGLDIEFADLSLSSEQLAPDLVVVTPVSGSVSAQFDPGAFPFGAELAGALGPEAQPVDAAGELGVDLSSLHIATVQRDGRWFVSVQYSVAELARRSAGMDLADAPMLEAVGADSPEALAAAVLGAFIGGGDVDSVAQYFAPGEGDAARRYPREWLTSFLGIGLADGDTATLSDLEVRIEGSGDRVRVVPTAFAVSGTLDAASRYGENPEVFDPTRPTLVSVGDITTVQYVWLDAGEAVPATAAELIGEEVLASYPVDRLETVDYAVNYAQELPDGTIDRAPDAVGVSMGSIAYRAEVRDGCAVVSSEGLSMLLGSGLGADVEQVGDNAWRSCSDPTYLGSVALSLYMPYSPFVSLPLPTLGAVRIDDRWYLSLVGTVAAQVEELVTPRNGGSGMFDTFVGWQVYGFGRFELLGSTSGTTIDQVLAECASLLTTDADGTVNGVVADPDPAQVRLCRDAYKANEWRFTTATDGGWLSYDPGAEVIVPTTTAVP